MNEQTTQLIEQLAQKLGTTTEYLWGILIKQAPVSATIDLIYFIIIIILCVLFWRIHRYFCKTDKYSDYEDLLIIPMVFIGSFILILAAMSFFSLGDIITAFINPEYWALDEVLDAMKN